MELFILLGITVYFRFGSPSLQLIFIHWINPVLLFTLGISVIIGIIITGAINLPFRFILFEFIVLFTTSWIIITKLDFIERFCLEYNYTSRLLFDIIVIGLAFLLVLSNERELRPNSKTSKSFSKCFFIFLFALFYAFNISLILGSVHIPSNLAKNDPVIDFLKDNIFVKMSKLDCTSDGNSVLNSNNNHDKKMLFAKSIYYFEKNEHSSTDSVMELVYKDKRSKLETIKLLNSLCKIRRINEKNHHLSSSGSYSNTDNVDRKRGTPIFYQYIFFRGKLLEFTIYLMPSVLWGQVSLSLFAGIFIQIIINRKPLISLR